MKVHVIFSDPNDTTFIQESAQKLNNHLTRSARKNTLYSTDKAIMSFKQEGKKTINETYNFTITRIPNTCPVAFEFVDAVIIPSIIQPRAIELLKHVQTLSINRLFDVYVFATFSLKSRQYLHDCHEYIQQHKHCTRSDILLYVNLKRNSYNTWFNNSESLRYLVDIMQRYDTELLTFTREQLEKYTG